MSWWKRLKGRVRVQEPLSRHTTFCIGGPVSYFIEPKDIDDLKLLLKILKQYRIPFRTIGAGSNILASDEGIPGAVIHLAGRFFSNLSFKGDLVKVGAAFTVGRLVSVAQKNSFSGVEFLAGIPASVGGAIVMNAGAWGKSIGDIVQGLVVVDYSGKLVSLSPDELSFGYRSSGLKDCIVLEARLRLKKGNRPRISQAIQRYINRRRMQQDLSFPSAGCVFKNPVGHPAAYLIERCGLKGFQVGGAAISVKHANFIINKNGATSRDVLALVKLVKAEVKKRFNIELEPEIKIWN